MADGLSGPVDLKFSDFVRPNGLANWRIDNLLRVWVVMVIDACDGNLGVAAEELGVNVGTLYRWRREWGMLGEGEAEPKGFKIVKGAG